MKTSLSQCISDADQIACITAHLKKGGFVNDASLWLAGVDQPIILINDVTVTLRDQNFVIEHSLRKLQDAAGNTHEILTWSAKRSQTPEPRYASQER